MRPEEGIPDVRDGLTRVERIILYEIRQAEGERPGRGIPAAQLYGRVCEHVTIAPERFMAILARLTGKGPGGR